MIYKDDYKHKGMRKSLINTLRTKGIKDESVIKAISKVPRHYFFDNALLHHAYEDKAFPIGNGQTISQPYTVARQTELLELEDGMKVLEIGTGSGYQAAILSLLKVKVYSIECVSPLFKKTKDHLRHLGYHVRCYYGDGSLGLPKSAPFDRILITAGTPQIPKTLIEQLKNGGVIVAPVGDLKTQEMVRIIKSGDGYSTEKHGFFTFVPLTGEKGWNQ
jgi:protein-L-isoaspartate(D-aspartate) O-methyltransferase